MASTVLAAVAERVAELRRQVDEWTLAVESARGFFERRERTKELKKWSAMLQRAERTYFNLRQGKLTLVEKSPGVGELHPFYVDQKRDRRS